MKNIQFFAASLFLVIIASCTPQEDTTSNNWPQYKNDNYRSGISSTQIDLKNLDQSWVYTADHLPVPAWYGPAYEDAFANSGPLPSMRDYDLAYYPIVIEDKLYYGSTSDDAIHCLDAQSGEELWRFTSNGPIHIAPVYDQGNLYFGSDDGYVYSISAKSGKLNWKYSPSDQKHSKVLNNGKLISFWPIRTGVLLEDGKVYFGASLLPWKQSYFCAIDQKTGKPNKEGCYVKEFEDRSLEGAMASSGSTLIQPQGRIAPAFFDKETGNAKGSLPGSGGCFVLVTKEEHIIHPNASRQKSLHELSKDDEPDFMTFNGGKEIVVKGDTSYVLTDNSLSAYERSTKKLIWLKRNFKAHRIIIAGDYLFAGSTDLVYGISTHNGLPLWKAEVQGTVFALAASGESLYASTGEGLIYKFSQGDKKNHLYAQNLNANPIIDEVSSDTPKSTFTNNLLLHSGPFIEPLSVDSVLLSFTTLEKEAFTVSWQLEDLEISSQNIPSGTIHHVTLPIRKDFRYTGTITSSENKVFSFEYDNFFNFKKTRLILQDKEDASHFNSELLNAVLNSEKLGEGVCFILGTSDERIPRSILSKTNHPIVQIHKSAKEIKRLRAFLAEQKLYGPQWAAYALSDLPLRQIRSNLASAIWVESTADYHPDQIIDLIAPNGKAAISGVGLDSEWMEDSNLFWQVDIEEIGGGLVFTKKEIENQGEWTHQYARSDNSAFGGESLYGSTSTDEFEIQWMGRPGPRFQTDRSGRKPSPLSISGKLFVQGKERVMAIDVYNGAVYWSKHFPGFIRMNIHRDCANWAADESFLYMAVNDKILKVDQETGDIKEIFDVSNKDGLESGYISVSDEFILGSTSPSGSHYTDYHGGAGWYDWAEGPMAEKVVSQSLFKKSKSTGQDIWRYIPKGVILNTSITQFEGKIYFVESRTRNLQLSEKSRAQDDVFDNTYLVSVNIENGETNFVRKLNHHPGKTSYSIAAGNGKLAILSSGDKNYHLYTHSVIDGELLWSDKIPWFNGDHGGHLSRPAIVGNKLVVKPTMYNLETGEPLNYNVPKSGHGCASYALTEQSIFYRGGSVTQFNFDTREFSRWERLRPDCWISTIPAQGMILSPEGGGGCSCGNWLETSMVMAPISRAPITIERSGNDHLIDFKDETYGSYHLEYLPNQFEEKMDVQIGLRPGTQGDIYFTLDGSQPSINSEKYTQPITISKSTEVKTLTVVETMGLSKNYYRSKTFSKANTD